MRTFIKQILAYYKLLDKQLCITLSENYLLQKNLLDFKRNLHNIVRYNIIETNVIYYP